MLWVSVPYQAHIPKNQTRVDPYFLATRVGLMMNSNFWLPKMATSETSFFWGFGNLIEYEIIPSMLAARDHYPQFTLIIPVLASKLMSI